MLETAENTGGQSGVTLGVLYKPLPRQLADEAFHLGAEQRDARGGSI
jgi:hypothetical protein